MTVGLVIGIFAILVIVLVLAPLMSRARRIASGATVRATRQGHGRSRAGVTAAASPSSPPSAGGTHVGMAEEGATLNPARIEGRVRTSSVKKVGQIVNKHPDEALSIIRSWMYQGT